MSLLDRVSTLLRANLNELVEKAEDPEVAIAIADQHLLEKKKAEHEQQAAEWRRKAELAVQKNQDDLARAALERALSQDQLVAGFSSQAEDQKHEADSLRQALHKLEQKLTETRAHCEMLIAEHRRAKVVGRAAKAQHVVANDQENTIGRMKSKVHVTAAENAAATEVLTPESLEDKFRSLENEDKVEMMLKELKSRQAVQ